MLKRIPKVLAALLGSFSSRPQTKAISKDFTLVKSFTASVPANASERLRQIAQGKRFQVEVFRSVLPAFSPRDAYDFIKSGNPLMIGAAGIELASINLRPELTGQTVICFDDENTYSEVMGGGHGVPSACLRSNGTSFPMMANFLAKVWPQEMHLLSIKEI